MMDERTRESLSALMDNEADELTLRRILSQSDDDQLRSLWGRYNRVSSLLSSGQFSYDNRSPRVEGGAESFLNIDISEQVSQAIEDEGSEKTDDTEPNADSPSVSAPVRSGLALKSGLAIAAAVALSFFLLLEPLNREVQPEGETAAIANSLPAIEHLPAEAVMRVSERRFTPEHERRFNEYLLRHAENSVSGGRSGMMPLARVASFTIAAN